MPPRRTARSTRRSATAEPAIELDEHGRPRAQAGDGPSSQAEAERGGRGSPDSSRASQQSSSRREAAPRPAATDGFEDDGDEEIVGAEEPPRVSATPGRGERIAGGAATPRGGSIGEDAEAREPLRATQDSTNGNAPAEADEAEEAPPPTFSAENEANHVKILLATDNHVGYMEKDPVRGQDSINTFREILKLAKDNDVDFILLGGDLFHENKPSRATLHQVIASLREYTLGDRPVSVELLSDPMDGHAAGYSFPAVNYEDANLNVAIPVFSIHGNHDDPQGVGVEGALSALDLLSVSGLVNYFGKVELPSSDAQAGQASRSAPAEGGLSDVGIRVRPVLLQKGQTKVALYGMGNIKDERMHYELRTNRVRMYRPREDPESWFNILAIHQNRVAHNPKAMVPETMFDDSVHLVVWGHEHEQLILPTPVAGKRYYISQPGSSVATSLSPGETAEKQAAILHIEDRDFMIEPLPLKTVRPFVMDDIDLDVEMETAGVSHEDRTGLNKLLKTQVYELIERAHREWDEQYAGVPVEDRPERMLPLVRLRVSYTHHAMGNLVRFGQEFVNKVANPKEILLFQKKRVVSRKKDQHGNEIGEREYIDPADMDPDLVPSEKLAKIDVGGLVQKYLQAQQLNILNPQGLERAVLNFVDKDDREAISHFVSKMLKTTVNGLVMMNPNGEQELNQELEKIAEEQQRRQEQGLVDEDDTEQRRPRGRTGRGRAANVASDDSMLEDEEVPEEDGSDDFDEATRPTARSARATKTATTTGGSNARGAARGRGSKSGVAAARGGPRARQAKPVFLGEDEDEVNDDEDDDDVEEIAPPPKPTSSRAAALSSMGKKPAAKTSAAATRRATASSSGGVGANNRAPATRQSQLAFAPSTPAAGNGPGAHGARRRL